MGTSKVRCCVVLLLLAMFFGPPASADIYRWDNGRLITEIDAEPGAQFVGEPYGREMNLRYADFTGANLAGANFHGANLTSADFAGANLTDIHCQSGDWISANLDFSDLRRPYVYVSKLLAAASTEGAIWPDGRIEGLTLDAGGRLSVRDYNGETAIPITVESGMSLDPAATLRMVFVDHDWGSTISFEPGIDVALGGSLELLFADDTNARDLIGTTFDLFDWEGAVVRGTFENEVLTDGGAV